MMQHIETDKEELALARERNKRFSTGKATLNELRREAGLPEIKSETFDKYFLGRQ